MSEFQSAGMPDLIACIERTTLAIEVKMPGEEPTLLQTFEMNAVIHAGGVAFVTCNPQDAIGSDPQCSQEQDMKKPLPPKLTITVDVEQLRIATNEIAHAATVFDRSIEPLRSLIKVLVSVSAEVADTINKIKDAKIKHKKWYKKSRRKK